jgi:hypothetical protein
LLFPLDRTRIVGPNISIHFFVCIVYCIVLGCFDGLFTHLLVVCLFCCVRVVVCGALLVLLAPSPPSIREDDGTAVARTPSAWSRRHSRRAGPHAAPTHHADAITDLKAIEFPQPMLATASRDGVVKIWA